MRLFTVGGQSRPVEPMVPAFDTDHDIAPAQLCSVLEIAH
jgi:hypothetical protein